MKSNKEIAHINVLGSLMKLFTFCKVNHTLTITKDNTINLLNAQITKKPCNQMTSFTALSKDINSTYVVDKAIVRWKVALQLTQDPQS